MNDTKKIIESVVRRKLHEAPIDNPEVPRAKIEAIVKQNLSRMSDQLDALLRPHPATEAVEECVLEIRFDLDEEEADVAAYIGYTRGGHTKWEFDVDL